jgi:hypothetical protein
MATLSVLTPTSTGDNDLGDAAVAAGGDQFLNDGSTILIFKNSNASDRTITIATGGTVNGLTVQDPTLVISQNETKVIGPFPTYPFNDSSGYVQLTYSADAGLTVRPIRVT